MKKIHLSILAIFAIFGFIACDPTPEPITPGEGEDTPTDTVTVNPLSAFIGDYDLQINVDGYYVDDVASDSQSENFSGTLSIAYPEGIENPNYVKVVGTFNFGGGEQRTIYNTTGTLDANGNLKLEDNIFSANVNINIAYSLINPVQPLTFHSTMTCDLMGYGLRYELDNIATRK